MSRTHAALQPVLATLISRGLDEVEVYAKKGRSRVISVRPESEEVAFANEEGWAVRAGNFQIWANSTGTGLPDRKPGDPLPRMVLDGMLTGAFDAAGRATEVRIWWHSMPKPT